MSAIPPFPEPFRGLPDDWNLQRLIEQDHPDLTQIPQAIWAEGMKRLEAIRPILDANTESALRQRALETQLSVCTLRRWRSRYLDSGQNLISLMRIPPQLSASVSHLDPATELILHEYIEQYLNDRQITPNDVINEVRKRVKQIGLTPPSPATIYRRLKDLNPARVMLGRRGRREWEQKFDPLIGEAFKGLCPLDLVEADHALLDIFVLDEDRITILGRAHATFFLDVFSRCVLAIIAGVEKPGHGELGLAISMAVLPKEPVLERLHLEYPWPCHGLFQTLLVDNAMEFQSIELQRALERYQLDVQYRMAGHPETGPHIERFIQEIQREMHRLPGTTERSPEARGDYKSSKHAALTYDDLNAYIFRWVLGTYHQRPHAGLEGKTPLEKWEEGISGTSSSPGLGEPRLPDDLQRFYIDFLPTAERQVLRDGIRLHNIWYQCDSLQGLIGLKPETPQQGVLKILVRYDPFDLSRIFAVDPRTQGYLVVPYRDSSHPPVTLREVRILRKEIRLRLNCPATEELLFRERERLRAALSSAVKSTKKARVMHARERSQTSHPIG